MTESVNLFQAENEPSHRVGSLFQGRFKAVHVDREEYLVHLSRYIHLNTAARRGLVQAEGPGPLSLTTRVRRPSQVLMAEITPGPAELLALAEAAERLLSIAPGMIFTFRVVLSAEGEQPDEETSERLNEVLEAVKPGWRLGGS